MLDFQREVAQPVPERLQPVEGGLVGPRVIGKKREGRGGSGPAPFPQAQCEPVCIGEGDSEMDTSSADRHTRLLSRVAQWEVGQP